MQFILIKNKNEYEFLCNTFTKYLDESNNGSYFMNVNIETKLDSFSHNETKFNLEPRNGDVLF